VLIHHEACPEPEHGGTKGTKSSDLQLSHDVVGAAIEVHRLLGPGLLESVYELALCKELWLRRVRVERQVELPILYKGCSLECSLKLDLLVDRRIVVEVKSIDKITNIQKAQVLTYLRLQQLWLGLLINFNVEVLRDGVRRVLNG
jgi:GxxExxY protein